MHGIMALFDSSRGGWTYWSGKIRRNTWVIFRWRIIITPIRNFPTHTLTLVAAEGIIHIPVFQAATSGEACMPRGYIIRLQAAMSERQDDAGLTVVPVIVTKPILRSAWIC
jgi:hypothetical protein